MTPHYRQSFVAALTGHLLLVIAAVTVSVLPGCWRQKPVDSTSFKFDITPIEPTPPSVIKQPTKNFIPPPTPPPLTSTEVPDPQVPDEPVHIKPRQPYLAPTQPTNRTEGVKQDRAPPHDTPTHVKPTPVASNKTAVAAVPVEVNKERIIRVTNTAAPQRAFPVKPLTTEELDPGGSMTASLGPTNSVPMDEQQRCKLLIKKALLDVWDRPTLADAGRQSAMLRIRFDASGRVVGYQIVQASGSDNMDRSVLLAAKAVVRVDNLTTAFLNEFPSLIVEFTLSE